MDSQPSRLETYYQQQKQAAAQQYGPRPPLLTRLALKGLETEVKHLRKLRKQAEQNPDNQKAQQRYQDFLNETELGIDHKEN